jgi:hypothetical protein
MLPVKEKSVPVRERTINGVTDSWLLADEVHDELYDFIFALTIGRDNKIVIAGIVA